MKDLDFFVKGKKEYVKELSEIISIRVNSNLKKWVKTNKLNARVIFETKCKELGWKK